MLAPAIGEGIVRMIVCYAATGAGRQEERITTRNR